MTDGIKLPELPYPYNTPEYRTVGEVIKEYTRAAVLADRERMKPDTARLEWYFGDTDKIDFVMTYLQGIKEKWTTDQWRVAIDTAMAAEKVSNGEK